MTDVLPLPIPSLGTLPLALISVLDNPLVSFVSYVRPEWARDAACREHPELDWYPQPGESSSAQVAVCESCPVRKECLAVALANNDWHGIWGGTSGRSRREGRWSSVAGRWPARAPSD